MQRRIEGPDVAGRRVLAVEDTSTTGGSVLTAVDALRRGRRRGGRRRDRRRPRAPGPPRPSEARGLAYRSLLGLADLGLGPSPDGARRPRRPERRARAPPSGAPAREPGRRRALAGRRPGPTTPATTPSCSRRATGATSSTATATGAARRSSPTSTRRRHPFHVADREPAPRRATSARSCAPPTRSPRPPCTSSGGGAGTGAARWSPTATSTSTTTPTSTRCWPGRATEDLAVVAVDNGPGAAPLETADLPRRCVLLFGQEGAGLTPRGRGRRRCRCSIAQFGSTRSINAGVAAGIAMHAWVRAHADLARPGAR